MTNVCAMCGLTPIGGGDLCLIHAYPLDGWAESNRIWCDYFHRGKVPIRLPDRDRGLGEMD